ncbi:MAG: TIGR00730 family Rossman fold protein [Betaproteobacteria bacterium]|nr:TIGR00730 family Rossman fold protein [Betaproteobacteria bacterium]
MDSPSPLQAQGIADAWTDLQAQARLGEPLKADANRLAFADPAFLLQRETRGIRIQLEMLKPDLAQAALGIDSTVVVFGSARILAPDQAQQRLVDAQACNNPKAIAWARKQVELSSYYSQARRFAQLVARHTASQRDPEKRLFVCTGGGPGIMEAANRGAHDEGALNVGLNIALPHEQRPNPYITPELCFKFHYFALRKMHFMMRAKALIAFPGGFGTLDEMFEMLTLVQCRKAKPVPILLYASTFWKRLIDFQMLAELGTISEEDLAMIRYVDSPEQAWDEIASFYKL